MLVCVKSEANTEIQFDIKKFNITLMAIFVTHIRVCSLHIVYMKRITVKTQKNLCTNSVKMIFFASSENISRTI